MFLLVLVKRLLLLSFTDDTCCTRLHITVTCDKCFGEDIHSLVNFLAPGCPSVDIQKLHSFLESCSEVSCAITADTAVAAAAATA